jgi:hypothetical protein
VIEQADSAAKRYKSANKLSAQLLLLQFALFFRLGTGDSNGAHVTVADNMAKRVRRDELNLNISPVHIARVATFCYGCGNGCGSCVARVRPTGNCIHSSSPTGKRSVVLCCVLFVARSCNVFEDGIAIGRHCS